MDHKEVAELMHIAEKLPQVDPQLHRIRNRALKRLREIDASLDEPATADERPVHSKVNPSEFGEPGRATTGGTSGEPIAAPSAASAVPPADAETVEDQPTAAAPGPVSSPAAQPTATNAATPNQPETPPAAEPDAAALGGPKTTDSPTLADGPLRRI